MCRFQLLGTWFVLGRRAAPFNLLLPVGVRGLRETNSETTHAHAQGHHDEKCLCTSTVTWSAPPPPASPPSPPLCSTNAFCRWNSCCVRMSSASSISCSQTSILHACMPKVVGLVGWLVGRRNGGEHRQVQPGNRPYSPDPRLVWFGWFGLV